jgi:hypothetical protein
MLVLPLPPNLPHGLRGALLEVGYFKPKIEAIILGGLQQGLGDIGNGDLFAAAGRDNLFRTFEKLAKRKSELTAFVAEACAPPTNNARCPLRLQVV